MADDLSDSARPIYLRVADALRQRFEPGGKLPSTPALAEEWGVARETIRSAIDVLKAEGLVTSSPGRGVYYRADAPDPNAAAGTDVTALLDQVLARLEDVEARLSALEGDRPAVPD
ncbi:winged helix-turn-helix domain-containing protein [Nocardia fusca]|uniref:Winged helix-turn-helix domain-containing protein n=1 Tax=Nocardia fusca TaxID=941183 RepID=A0ABV3F8P5_9NOCA